MTSNARAVRSGIFIGLMSGTSADGIDAAVVEVPRSLRPPAAVRLLAHAHLPFPEGLRQRILALCRNGTVAEVCEMNVLLGERFGAAALKALRVAGLRPEQVQAIGSHGQTIHHLPNARTPSTLQIGEPSVIAERTGIITVSNFRPRDMAVGGQGAPLVPLLDWMLFTSRQRPRIIQNIGGIGNLTFLPPGAALSDVIAFDTGPGNMAIDALVQLLTAGKVSFDKNGRVAQRGCVSQRLLAASLKHPFLKRPPPKTTGREEFGWVFLESFLRMGRKFRVRGDDLVTTATALTAETIADACRRFVLPRLASKSWDRLECVLGGGGAKNPVLRRMVSERLPFARVLTHADCGIPDEAKEAMAFAILARQTLWGLPGNVPGATGATAPVVLGSITPGRP